MFDPSNIKEQAYWMAPHPIPKNYTGKSLPHLEKVAIDYCWFGKVCFTVDRFPIIGQHDGISYAMGYCGHGVAMATYFGYKLSDLILGKGLHTVFC